MKKRYLTLNDFLKSYFGGKIAKVSINAGFSCPNRENGKKGCLFCTESGGSEYSGNSTKSISGQIAAGKKKIAKKWNPSGYIAYFQNYTNTYAEPEKLREVYCEAMNNEGIAGLAVATRPDCISDSVLDILTEFNKRTFLWVELGLQTSNELTAEEIGRGYRNFVFENAVRKLKKSGIRVVVHLIAGLPGERKEDFLNSIVYINSFKPWGVKFHNIYIQTNSPLYEYSVENDFHAPGMYEYIDWVTDGLIILNDETIVHRLTGDPSRNLLVEPMWIRNKLKVLSEIDRILEEKLIRRF